MHCKLLLKFKTIAQESLKNELMSSAASIHYLNPVQPSPARVTESLWSSISLESAWSFPGIFLFCEVALKSWCKGTLLGLWLCTWPSSLLQLLFSSGRETCACRSPSLQLIPRQQQPSATGAIRGDIRTTYLFGGVGGTPPCILGRVGLMFWIHQTTKA